MKKILFFLVWSFVSISFADDVSVIYNGQPALPVGINVSGWGVSGRSGVKPGQIINTGGNLSGFKVSIQGKYAGTRIDIKDGIDSQPIAQTSNVYMEMYMRSSIGPIEPLGADGKPLLLPTVKNLRITIITTDSNVQLTVPEELLISRGLIDDRWARVDIPMALLLNDQKLTGKITRLIFTAENENDFLLGRLAFIRDNKQISLKLRTFPATSVTVGKRVSFFADIEAGLAFTDVSWNFDSANGNNKDALGDHTTHVFAKPGQYIVSCTVLDKNGGKTAVTRNIQINVSEAVAQ
ncbi:MAG: PKD domain-containing protein [bacterium]